MKKSVLRYGDRRIEFELVADPKRKGAIRIVADPMKGVRVLAPLSAEAGEVHAAIRRRVRWISRQLEGANVSRGSDRFVSGEQVLYLGRRYMLKVAIAPTTSVKLRGGVVCVEVPERSPAQVSDALVSWYRDLAKRYFEKRVLALYSAALDGGDGPPSFFIRSMSRQWGSCSPAGRLVLNSALVRAPRECIDYVVAHELCHLRHHDHSPAFKKLLSNRMPDWEGRKALLEQFARDVLK